MPLDQGREARCAMISSASRTSSGPISTGRPPNEAVEPRVSTTAITYPAFSQKSRCAPGPGPPPLARPYRVWANITGAGLAGATPSGK